MTARIDDQAPKHVWAFFDHADEIRGAFEPRGAAGRKMHKSLTDRIRDRGRHWFGCTPAEGERYLRDGWKEGAERSAALASGIIPPAQHHDTMQRRRRMLTGDHGDELRPEAVLGLAQPDQAWRRCGFLSMPAMRHVTLLCNLSINCDVSADQAFWRGAAVLAALELVRRSGRHVEVIGWSGSREDSQRVCLMVQALRAGEPADPERLAALLCLPYWNRRYVHEAIAMRMPQFGDGLGYALADVPAEAMAHARIDPARVHPMGLAVKDEHSARLWLQGLVGFLAKPAQE